MKIIKFIAACLAAVVQLMSLTGCSHKQSTKLANEITFPLDGVSEITISYDDEKVTFYESQDDKLKIKEYMTKSKNSYFAKIDQGSDRIKITEGGKPIFKDGFSRYIEVYLPASYYKNITVTTTDGDIDISNIEIMLDTLRIDSTVGTIRLSDVEAQNVYLSTTGGMINVNCLKANLIRIATTSGDFNCKKLEGNVDYTTTNGNVNIQSAIGAGAYKTDNSGDTNVAYTEINGDILFYNKNGAINIALPVDSALKFEATTKNGTISTPFQDRISIEGRTTSCTIGEQPTVSVHVETKNGDITLRD